MTKTPAKKSATERKAEERERNRAAGYVLKQIWVNPKHWDRIQKYLARVDR